MTEAISFVSSLRASRSMLRETAPYGTPPDAWRLSDIIPTIEQLLSRTVVSPYGLMGRNGRLAHKGTLGTRIKIAGIWSLSPSASDNTWNNLRRLHGEWRALEKYDAAWRRRKGLRKLSPCGRAVNASSKYCSLEQERQRKRRMEKKMDRTVLQMARAGSAHADSVD